jgi:hypothetical protein
MRGHRMTVSLLTDPTTSTAGRVSLLLMPPR